MTEAMRYREPEQIEPEEAVKVFRTGKPEDIARALIGLALKGQCHDFTLLWCIFFLGHGDDAMAGAAAVSIGHLARVHRRLSKPVVVPILELVRNRGRITDQVDNALDDIAMFCSGT